MKTLRFRIFSCLALLSVLISACGGGKLPAQSTPTLAPTSAPTSLPQPTSTPKTLIDLLKNADPGDPLAPKVISQSPAAEEEAPLNATFDIIFDQSMDQALTAQALSILGPDEKPVTGKTSWPQSRLLRFTPDQPLRPASKYLANLAVAARSTAGKNLAEPMVLNFVTVGDLQVTQVTPANGTTEVDPKAVITVIFNRPVVPLSLSVDQANLPDPLEITPSVPGKGEWLNTSVFIFRPDPALTGATNFEVRVKAGLTDQSGMQLPEDFTWQFSTTAPSLDAINLPDTAYAPPEGLQNVPLDQSFELLFHQPMNTDSAQNAFSITGPSGEPVQGQISWNDSLTQMVFTPTVRMALGTDYLLKLDQSAQDSYGGTLRESVQWHFTTVFPPGIARTAPYNGESQGVYNGILEIDFISPMKQTSLKDKVTITPAIEGDAQWMYSDWNMTLYGLQPSTQYSVQIQPGMTDVYGNPIQGVYSFSFRTGPYSPEAYLMLPQTPGLLRAMGPQEFFLDYVNVKKVSLSLYRLEPQEFINLANGMVPNNSYRPASSALIRSWDINNTKGLNDRTQEKVALQDSDGQSLTAGLYYLALDTDEIRHESQFLDGRVLVVAKANLTFKGTPAEALYWLTDLESGAPISSASVEVYDKNGASIGQGTTDSDGLVHLDLPVPVENLGEIRYAMAKSGDELIAFAMNDWTSQVFLNDFGLWVDYYRRPNQPFAYVYTDRPLYRPGQTVYFKGIVRDNNDLNYSLPDMPSVQIGISSYEGRVFTETLSLDSTGSFSGQLELDQDAALGSYGIDVLAPGQEYSFASVSFSVAEYRKPEFLLDVRASTTDLLAGEPFSVTVDAQYYAGGAVANADVNWVISASPYSFIPVGDLTAKGFRFADFNQDLYYYQIQQPANPKIIAQGKGLTDGRGLLTLTLPAELGDAAGSQQLVFEATVTDPAKNEVSERASLIAHRSQIYPGIKSDRYVGQVNEEQTFTVAVVDWKSEPVANQPVTVDIVERRWYSVQEEDALGRLRWTTSVQDIPVKAISGITTDEKGMAKASFTPGKGGVYRARVTVRDSKGNSAKASTYLWVSGEEYIPWRQENNKAFDLIADKKTYTPGETAEILIASPFQGNTYALVTVERGHILKQEVVKLETNSTIYRLPITPDLAPNAYISVLVMKGASEVDGTIQPPDFKIGMVEIGVDRQQQNLTVTITPDRPQVGPGEVVTYNVQTLDYAGQPVSADVSLSMVDLAVLSMTQPNTAPILDAFYPHSNLGIMTAVPLNWSIEQYNLQIHNNAPDGRGGGSGGGKGEGSLGVFEVRGRFMDTAFWQASLQTDANGQASVTFTLPDNLTTWRMDARAATQDSRVGQATVDIVSTKPLLLRPQAPRFFVQGDEAILSAAVHNNTQDSISAEVTLQAEGLDLTSPATQIVTIPVGNQALVSWNAAVTPGAERVDLIFSAEGGGYSDASRPTLGTLDGGGIPVYTYQVQETVGTAGSIREEGARTEGVSLPLFTDFQPTSGTLTVNVAPSMSAGLTDGLTYLEDYPYECTEQTVSRFLPNLMSVRALRQAGLSDPDLEANLDSQVNTALQRLMNQQHVDGGWGWWPGEKSDSQVTAYVVLALVEALNDGFPVNTNSLDRGQQYLYGQSLVSLRLLDQPHLLNRQAFIVYVLAKAGNPAVGQTVNLFEARQNLALYAQAYLAQALYTIDPGDPRLQTILADLTAKAGLSATGMHWNEQERDDWNWNTDVRSTAIILDALVKIDPQNQLNENVVRWLMAARVDGHWQGTQETAWSLMALTDWMSATNELQANYQYEVGLNGEHVGGNAVDASNLRSSETIQIELSQLLADQVNRLTLARTAGPGSLYYSAHLNLSIPVEQVQPLDRGIAVTRQYYRLDDLENPVTEIQQGETLQVRLTVVLPHDVHYIVVEDPLPAGLEPVDETLKTSRTILPDEQGNQVQPWADYYNNPWEGWGWWYFDHVELRDEKAVLSSDYLPAGTYEYTYHVRAATPGSFHVIPTSAYEFYFPEVYGRGAGMMFTVIK